MDAMINHDHKDKDTLALIRHTAEEDRLARLLKYQMLSTIENLKRVL